MRIEGLDNCIAETRIVRADGTVLLVTRVLLSAPTEWNWRSDDGSQIMSVRTSMTDMCRCKVTPERCPVHGSLLREPLPVFED